MRIKISALFDHKTAHFPSDNSIELLSSKAPRNFLFRTSRIAIDSFFPLQVAFELSGEHNMFGFPLGSLKVESTRFSAIALGPIDGTSHAMKLTDDASSITGFSSKFDYVLRGISAWIFSKIPLKPDIRR